MSTPDPVRRVYETLSEPRLINRKVDEKQCGQVVEAVTVKSPIPVVECVKKANNDGAPTQQCEIKYPEQNQVQVTPQFCRYVEVEIGLGHKTTRQCSAQTNGGHLCSTHSEPIVRTTTSTTMLPLDKGQTKVVTGSSTPQQLITPGSTDLINIGGGMVRYVKKGGAVRKGGDESMVTLNSLINPRFPVSTVEINEKEPRNYNGSFNVQDQDYDETYENAYLNHKQVKSGYDFKGSSFRYVTQKYLKTKEYISALVFAVNVMNETYPTYFKKNFLINSDTIATLEASILVGLADFESRKFVVDTKVLQALSSVASFPYAHKQLINYVKFPQPKFDSVQSEGKLWKSQISGRYRPVIVAVFNSENSTDAEALFKTVLRSFYDSIVGEQLPIKTSKLFQQQSQATFGSLSEDGWLTSPNSNCIGALESYTLSVLAKLQYEFKAVFNTKSAIQLVSTQKYRQFLHELLMGYITKYDFPQQQALLQISGEDFILDLGQDEFSIEKDIANWNNNKSNTTQTEGSMGNSSEVALSGSYSPLVQKNQVQQQAVQGQEPPNSSGGSSRFGGRFVAHRGHSKGRGRGRVVRGRGRGFRAASPPTHYYGKSKKFYSLG